MIQKQQLPPVSSTGIKQPVRIALVGAAHSGKTTTSNLIHKYMKMNGVEGYPHTFKMAYPLYEALACLQQNTVRHEYKNRDFFTKTAATWKEVYGKYVFIEHFMSRVQGMPSNTNIICDDIRASYELDGAHSLGFIGIYVDSKDAIRERRLDDAFVLGDRDREYDEKVDWDYMKRCCKYTIENNSSLLFLEEQVNDIMDDITCR